MVFVVPNCVFDQLGTVCLTDTHVVESLSVMRIGQNIVPRKSSDRFLWHRLVCLKSRDGCFVRKRVVLPLAIATLLDKPCTISQSECFKEVRQVLIDSKYCVLSSKAPIFYFLVAVSSQQGHCADCERQYKKRSGLIHLENVGELVRRGHLVCSVGHLVDDVIEHLSIRQHPVTVDKEE